MKIILSGTALQQYDTKEIEINGKPMERILGTLRTDAGEIFPITVWGTQKCTYWKNFANANDPVSIVVELQAKPTTFTNHEGQTVTAPNIQLKLYSYLVMPTAQQRYANTNLLPPPAPTNKSEPWPRYNGPVQGIDF